MTIFISEIPPRPYPLLFETLAGMFSLTFFAPKGQPVFRPAVSGEMTLVLPLLAATAQLLLDTANCPVTLLISQILSNDPPALPATLPFIRRIAAFTIKPQSVLSGTVFPEFAFVLPLPASSTALLLHAPKLVMRFLIAVVFFGHCLGSLWPPSDQATQPSSFVFAFYIHTIVHVLDPIGNVYGAAQKYGGNLVKTTRQVAENAMKLRHEQTMNPFSQGLGSFSFVAPRTCPSHTNAGNALLLKIHLNASISQSFPRRRVGSNNLLLEIPHEGRMYRLKPTQQTLPLLVRHEP